MIERRQSSSPVTAAAPNAQAVNVTGVAVEVELVLFASNGASLEGVALGPLDPGNVRGIEARRAERGERGGTPPHCSGPEREPSPLFGVGGGSSGVVSGSPGRNLSKGSR